MKDPFIYEEVEGETIAILNPQYAEFVNKKKYEYTLKKSNIPKFYWDIEFDNYVGSNSLSNKNKVIQYANSFNQEKFNHVHLYLYGINNSQKTALACNIGKIAIKRGFSVRFELASVLIDLLTTHQFSPTPDTYYKLEAIKSCDVIIIDDIFDSTKSRLYKNPDSATLIISAWDSFIREVVCGDSKLVVTSNIPISLIEEKYGKSMFNLVDRNFVSLEFYDDVKAVRKDKFKNLFDEDSNVNTNKKRTRKTN